MEGGAPHTLQITNHALKPASAAKSSAIAGLTMGDSLDELLQEVSEGGHVKTVKVDNTNAVNVLTQPAGSWRTTPSSTCTLPEVEAGKIGLVGW